jgi:hypothetical protein
MRQGRKTLIVREGLSYYLSVVLGLWVYLSTASALLGFLSYEDQSNKLSKISLISLLLDLKGAILLSLHFFLFFSYQGLSVAFAGGSHQSSRNLSLILSLKGKLHLLHVENKRARWGKEETMADGEKFVCSPEVVGVWQWCWFHDMRKR